MATLYVGTSDGDFATVDAAVKAASAGDTIIIQGSEYTATDERVRVDKSLTLKAEGDVTMRGLNIGGKDFDLVVDGINFVAAEADASGVTGYSGNASCISQVGELRNVTVTNCTFDLTNAGMTRTYGMFLSLGTWGFENLVVTDNVCNGYYDEEAYSGYGLIYAANVNDADISNNTITYAASHAIQLSLSGKTYQGSGEQTVQINGNIIDKSYACAVYCADLQNSDMTVQINDNAISNVQEGSCSIYHGAIRIGQSTISGVEITGNVIEGAQVGIYNAASIKEGSDGAVVIEDNAVAVSQIHPAEEGVTPEFNGLGGTAIPEGTAEKNIIVEGSEVDVDESVTTFYVNGNWSTFPEGTKVAVDDKVAVIGTNAFASFAETLKLVNETTEKIQLAGNITESASADSISVALSQDLTIAGGNVVWNAGSSWVWFKKADGVESVNLKFEDFTLSGAASNYKVFYFGSGVTATIGADAALEFYNGAIQPGATVIVEDGGKLSSLKEALQVQASADGRGSLIVNGEDTVVYTKYVNVDGDASVTDSAFSAYDYLRVRGSGVFTADGSLVEIGADHTGTWQGNPAPNGLGRLEISDADAVFNLKNGSTLKVSGNVTNNGTLNIEDSTFVANGTLASDGAVTEAYNKGVLTNNGTINVAGKSTLNIRELAGSRLTFAENTTLADSNINYTGSDSFRFDGVTFEGDNTINSTAYATSGMSFTIAEGGSLKATGARWTLGGTGIWNINGTIENARELTAEEKAELTASLDVNGLSLSTGGGEAVMNVTDAYFTFGSGHITTKNTNSTGGKIVMNFTNSVVESTYKYSVNPTKAGYDAANAPEVVLNVTGSVFKINNYFTNNHAKGTVNVDNSDLTATAFGNVGTFSAVNGSVVNFSLVNNALGDWAGKGSLNAGSMLIDNSTLNIANKTASLEFYNVSEITLANGAVFTLDRLVNAQANNLTGSGNINTTFADMTGNITISGDSQLTVSTLFTNDGTITVDAGSTITAAAITNNGTITINAKGYTGDTIKVIDLSQDTKLTGVKLTNASNKYYLTYGEDGDVILNKSPEYIYVSSDYNSTTEGYGYDKFSNYDSAVAFAKNNAPKATIVMEKTTTISGNCVKDKAEDLGVDMTNALVIKDGAVMGNSQSKWDMTYAVTIEAGGILQSGRPASAGYGNTHIKNKLTIGEADSEKRAEIRFINGESGITYKTMSIALLSAINRSITANNALIEVGDLGLLAKASFTDTELVIDGILAAKGTGTYSTVFTDSTVTIKGHNLMNENTYYSTVGTILSNMTMDNTSMVIDDGVEATAAEKVWLGYSANAKQTLALTNGSIISVEKDTIVGVANKVTVTDSAIYAGDVDASATKAESFNFNQLEKGKVYYAVIYDAEGNEIETIVRTSTSGSTFSPKFSALPEGAYRAVCYADEAKTQIHQEKTYTFTAVGSVELVNSDFYAEKLLLAGGSNVTMDINSTLGFSSVEGGYITVTNAADYVDNEGVADGTYLLFDYTGDAEMTVDDYKALLNGEWHEDYKVINNDLYLTDQEVGTLYVNSAWADMEVGEATAEGYLYGFNAASTVDEVTNMIATDGSDTTVKFLSDIEVAGDQIFNYGTGDITFTADSAVTITQESAQCGFYFITSQLDKEERSTITIGENVTFELSDNVSDFAVWYGANLTVDGTIKGGANWGSLYAFYGDHTISSTGTVATGRVALGFGTLTVNGDAESDRTDAHIDTNYLLIEQGTFTANNAIIDAGTVNDNNNGGLRYGASEFNINDSELTANTLLLKHADTVFNVSGGSANIGTVNNASLINVENGASVDFGTLTNNGSIAVAGASFAADTINGTRLNADDSALININAAYDAEGNAIATELNIRNGFEQVIDVNRNGAEGDKVILTGNVNASSTANSVIRTFGDVELSEFKENVDAAAVGKLFTDGNIVIKDNSDVNVNWFQVKGNGTIEEGSTVTAPNVNIYDHKTLGAVLFTVNGTLNADTLIITNSIYKEYYGTNDYEGASDFVVGETGVIERATTGAAARFDLQLGKMTVYGYVNQEWNSNGGTAYIGNDGYSTTLTVDGTYAAADNNKGKFINSGTQNMEILEGSFLNVINNGTFSWAAKITNDAEITVDNSNFSVSNLVNNNIVTVTGASKINIGTLTGEITLDNAALTDSVINKGNVNFKGDNTFAGDFNAAYAFVGDWNNKEFDGSVDFGTQSNVNVNGQMIIGYDTLTAGANNVVFGDVTGETVTDKVFKAADISVRRDGTLTIANTSGDNNISTMNVMGSVVIDNAKLSGEVQIGNNVDDIDAVMTVKNGAQVNLGGSSNSVVILGKSNGGILNVDDAEVVVKRAGAGAGYQVPADTFVIGYKGGKGELNVYNNGKFSTADFNGDKDGGKMNVELNTGSVINVTDNGSVDVSGVINNAGKIAVNGGSLSAAGMDVQAQLRITGLTAGSARTIKVSLIKEGETSGKIVDIDVAANATDAVLYLNDYADGNYSATVIDGTSAFRTDIAVVNGLLEVADGTLDITGTLALNMSELKVSGESTLNIGTLSGTAYAADDTTLVDSNVGGKVVMQGDLAIKGDNTVKTLSSTVGGTLSVEEGKTLALGNFSFGSKDNADAEYTITGGKVTANYGFFQHGTYTLESDFETGYMYYSYGSDITVKGTFHSKGAGDGLDYVRGKLTIAEEGQTIHDASLWIGQPESWGEMNASMIVEGVAKANSISVYAGSSLSVNGGTVEASTVSNTGDFNVAGDVTLNIGTFTGVLTVNGDTVFSADTAVTVNGSVNADGYTVTMMQGAITGAANFTADKLILTDVVLPTDTAITIYAGATDIDELVINGSNVTDGRAVIDGVAYDVVANENGITMNTAASEYTPMTVKLLEVKQSQDSYNFTVTIEVVGGEGDYSYQIIDEFGNVLADGLEFTVSSTPESSVINIGVKVFDTYGETTAIVTEPIFSSIRDYTAPVFNGITASTTEETKRAVILTADFADNFDAAVSGNLTITYSIDGGNSWLAYEDGAKITANGTVIFKATDAEGNSTTAEYVVDNIITEADYDKNGLSDTLFVHDNKLTSAWFTNADDTEITLTDLGTMDDNMDLLGSGRIFGSANDGSDIFFTDGTTVKAWDVQNGAIAGTTEVWKMDANREILGVGDFNGDGATDILIKSNYGDVGAIYAGAESKTTWNYFSSLGSEWKLTGIGDFNGDGVDDVALFNTRDGNSGCWISQEDGSVLWTALDKIPNGEIIGAGDFNGDGVDDVLLRKGDWVGAWIVEDGRAKEVLGLGNITATVEQIADFNGDGIDDLRVRDENMIGVITIDSDGKTQWKEFVGVGDEWKSSNVGIIA